MNPDFFGHDQHYSVLTNGFVALEIQCSRHNCGFDIPIGITYSIRDGRYYLNGKEAWIEVRKIGN